MPKIPRNFLFPGFSVWNRFLGTGTFNGWEENSTSAILRPPLLSVLSDPGYASDNYGVTTENYGILFDRFEI